MAKASRVKLLSFTVPNTVGQLAAASELIAGAKLEITAFCALDAGNTAEFLLATDRNAKAKKALAPLGVEIREEEAVRIELANKPGRLHKTAKKLAAAGINIRLSWATAFGGKTAYCVLMTSDDAKTVALVNAKG
jgi:hypothetical protein